MNFQQRTRVKICGLTRVEDIHGAVAAGADAIGLVFYPPSPRAVSIENAEALAKAIPAFVTSTGLFVNETAENIAQILSRVPLELLQFHGDESPEFCRQFNRAYIKAVRVNADTDLHALALQYDDAKALLLDTYRPGVPGGTGETFDWGLIPPDLPKPIILAGGLNASNVGDAISTVQPFAIDVSGGVESAKGIKSQTLIENLMKEVSCANQR